LKGRRDAQTLVFFLLAWGTIMLLCGLAIDSGLLYLAKARLSRAVDGAALAAVGNFDMGTASVAGLMRNVAVANYSDLGTIASSSSPSSVTTSTSTSSTGSPTTILTYNFNDGTQDANGQYRRYVQVVLTTGAGGQVTSATCNARCPVQTYFIGYAQGIIGGFRGISAFKDLKVSSAAVATRNPRLIMVVIDRSGSMLQSGGGAFGLPQSVMTFLNFFDTSSDYIGIVSFGSFARLEMPLTTNFLEAATNNLCDSYNVITNTAAGGYGGAVLGVPAVDPEQDPASSSYTNNYATQGVRRLKFGGTTAADEGLRVALECMMSNSGFNNPDVVKYIVLFTDGKWNNTRTLVAAPTYTNWVSYPDTNTDPGAYTTPFEIVSNKFNTTDLSGDLTNAATNMVFMPSLSPMPGMTNAVNSLIFSSTNIANHANDYWISLDTNDGGGPAGVQLEPLPGSSTAGSSSGRAGAPVSITNSNFVGMDPITGITNDYSSTVNVWVQPGAVAYVCDSNGTPFEAYLGDLNNPTNTVTVPLAPGEQVQLVVPGYVLDGGVYDGLDMGTIDDSSLYNAGAPDNFASYRWDNFNLAFEWPDDLTPAPAATDGNDAPFYYDETTSIQNGVVRDSTMRSLMFRNYVNDLTGYYVYRSNDPVGTGVEPLTGALRPYYGFGSYYPEGVFYWPFDMVGIDWDATYALADPLVDPDPTGDGLARHEAYSMNMLSSNAAPAQNGELFYMGTNGALSSTTAASSVMSSASSWKSGAPSWVIGAYGVNMTTDPTLNTNISPNPQDWRPNTFVGTNIGVSNSYPTPGLLYSNLLYQNPSETGGYVYDSSSGNIYSNTMCWNGRPTHYYDFSKSTWVAIPNNHYHNSLFLPLGFWKAQEYAWHARAAGVTIFTVGYGSLVEDSEQLILAQVANATNTTAGGGSNITYISSQPIGQQYQAYSTADISNDFYQIGTAINAALTGGG
ncbi:MAG TPA: pilus assembly protein TadG-related protein, partial [Candidatus Methylacidiphilales bacterium]|nr:pilus assembly protein TadG-related protein [Candidatus Methylacidiphilales bacterium]